MALGQLIEILRAEPDKSRVISPAFTHPHSYRGYYEQLAVEPCPSSTVGQMLQELEEAVGKTYEGYKGGDFTMDENTRVWLAYYGDYGSEDVVGPEFLRLMLTPKERDQ